MALSRGIQTPSDFLGFSDSMPFIAFFKAHPIDVLHIHSLIGLPIGFIQAASLLKIPIFLTTHDYFGLSPVPNFFDEQNSIDYAKRKASSSIWQILSSQALSTKALKVYQLVFYPQLRSAFHFLRRINFSLHTQNFSTQIPQVKKKLHLNTQSQQLFQNLMIQYQTELKMVTCFLFNSSLTQNVYKFQLPWLNQKNSCVLPIINAQINYNSKKGIIHKQIHITENDKFKLGYIGPATNAKGFYYLLNELKQMNTRIIELHNYGNEFKDELPGLKNHGRFKRTQLHTILQKLDLLIVPSLWHETFGFVVSEALSIGTPVMTSTHVGASQLIDTKFTFSPTKGSLAKMINTLISKREVDIRENYSAADRNMEEHVGKLENIYRKFI